VISTHPPNTGSVVKGDRATRRDEAFLHRALSAFADRKTGAPRFLEFLVKKQSDLDRVVRARLLRSAS
jgi:hypothetical protein